MACNFHGTITQAASKIITAKDLGFAPGDIVYVEGIDVEAITDVACTYSSQVADIAVKGEGDPLGPRSPNFLLAPGIPTRVSFKNPNPVLYFSIHEDNDALALLHSQTTATVTLAGTVWIRVQGTHSHALS